MMKKVSLCLFLLLIGMVAVCQTKPGTTLPNFPPGYLEQIKKYLPPGTKLPDEMIKAMNEAQNSSDQNSSGQQNFINNDPLIQMAPVQEYTYNPEPSPKADYSPFGSGRNESERRAALIAVENELNGQPFLLPKPESTPTKEYMLGMAAERSKMARQKFSPDELTNYSRLVTWVPEFTMKNPDPEKAKKFSMAVAVATNNYPRPYFNMAVAAAVFSLDPISSVSSNNLASAILSSGEMICEKNISKDALAPFRRDAESGFLYSIAHSMKDGKWSEASLTPVLNMGNLCMDLGRLEEARSLFMVARKIKPESWEAALGLASYFMAKNQSDKALAILEDDNLDKPVKYLIPVKANKSLEKSEEFSDLPVDAPEAKFEEGIKIMAAEPVLTSADFVVQLDQSERNKMRYFIEHLAPLGSYKAPSIKKLTQYASLKAISGPQGISALNDFSEMLGALSLGSFASTANTQLEWLSQMGLKIDPGVDLDDVAKHPEKYANKKLDPNVKVTGKEEFIAKMKAMGQDANKAKLDLATGKTTSTITMASNIDRMHAILLINPDDYADPMNIIMQKMNYTVYQRKSRLYKGYLYSLNKKTSRQLNEITTMCQRKMEELQVQYNAELEEFHKQREEAEKRASDSGMEFPKAQWDLREHGLHKSFFNRANNIQETGFGSATNVVTTAYINRFKPAIEGYYCEVFPHIAMISDTEVRKQKDADMRNSITQALTMNLNLILMAHGSFSYHEEWECDCDEAALIAAREAEEKAMEAEENARIMRNKAAKAVFDSGEPPEGSQLFKKMDAYVDVYNFGLVKVRASCARTVVEANTDFLPNDLPFNLFYKSTESEFTGATTRNGGIKVGLEKKFEGGKATANLNLEMSVSTNGNGVVKNYSVTGGAEVGVEVKDFQATAGASMTYANNGVNDYSVSGNVNATVKYGDTTVSGGATATFGPKGMDTDFSAKISQDFKNEFGGSGNVTMEASTKRGCSFSGKVEQSLDPAKKLIEASGAEKIAKEHGLKLPTDFLTKEGWSGKFEIN